MVNSASHTASFTQRAALEALTGPQDSVGVMVAEFSRRRDLIVDGFNNIPGFSCVRPSGAFYAFPNIKDTGLKSTPLAQIWAEMPAISRGDFNEAPPNFTGQFLELVFVQRTHVRRLLDPV